MQNVLLDVQNISMKFGGLTAVSELAFKINRGQLTGLIGPNGAGKTTAFNMLTGVYQPSSGEIFFKGESLKNKKPFQISRLGVARTFQNIRLFKGLSVIDNVLIAAHQHNDYGMLAAVLRTSHFLKSEDKQKQKAYDLLKIFGLEHKAQSLASSLPYGEQRKLEIVRALATEPELILLDEPAAGMNHSETHQLMDLIAKIQDEFKLSVLLIEHDMKLVMGICQNIIVLDHGQKIEEGDANRVQNSQKVIEAYLGVDEVRT